MELPQLYANAGTSAVSELAKWKVNGMVKIYIKQLLNMKQKYFKKTIFKVSTIVVGFF